MIEMNNEKRRFISKPEVVQQIYGTLITLIYNKFMKPSYLQHVKTNILRTNWS